MDRRRTVLLGFTLMTLALTGCGALTGTPEATEPAAALPDDVERAAKEVVSVETGIPVAEIEVTAAERRDWPDACLGLPEEGEARAQVITPGWKVTLRAEDATYVLHTNDDGTAVRVEE